MLVALKAIGKCKKAQVLPVLVCTSKWYLCTARPLHYQEWLSQSKAFAKLVSAASCGTRDVPSIATPWSAA